MSAFASVSARRWVAALGMLGAVVACGNDGDGGKSSGAAGATSSTGAANGTGSGGTAGDGGHGASGGDPGTECRQDADCVAANECYSAACRAGTCVSSLLERGSACSNGFCNGFARCLSCLDDAAGAGKDPGCSAARPLCTETAAEPACVACVADADCNDDRECTIDRCRDGACENTSKPAGNLCSAGVCNGEADEHSCGACLDNEKTGTDLGCTPEQPTCDAEQAPAVCVNCAADADCDDKNECTTDACQAGVCRHATLVSGSPCSDGYCNGIPGLEVCVTKPCQTDEDCDDRAACTGEVCKSSICVYTPDDSGCPDSGDVCKPNVCTVGTGCVAHDVTQSLALLVNGNLDLGSDMGWLEQSTNYAQVIYPYDYGPTLEAHTPIFIAWLGGGEGGLMNEQNALSQVVHVPNGAVRLELSFFYQIWEQAGLDDSQNYLEVHLRSDEADKDETLVTFYNQDNTRVWTGFTATLDAADWAGTDATLEFAGSAVGGYTHFFVDTISLVATVCE